MESPLHESIPYAVGVPPKTVTPFSSLTWDRGLVRSQRDDLESLIDALEYQLKECLPYSDEISVASGNRKHEENVA